MMEKKIMGRKVTRLIYLYLVALFLGSYLVFSQVSAPKNFKATPIGDNQIKLEWEKPGEGEISYYRISRAIENENPIFSFLADVSGSMNQYVDYTVQKDEKYRYYVVAYRGYEASQKVYTFAKAGGGGSLVAIVSNPKKQAYIGGYYEYNISAGSTDPSAVFRYKLLQAPKNMTIDSITGVIRWVPNLAGRYNIKVLARNIADSALIKYGIPAEGVQNFEILVAARAGNVFGIVKSEDGKPIANASLRFYEINNEQYTYDVKTDVYGYYLLTKISAGSYKVYVKAPEPYSSMWYDRATDQRYAALLPVTENSNTQQDFTLLPKTFSNAYISGVVKDTFGNPIQNAYIKIYDASNYLNIGKDDKSLELYIDPENNKYPVYTNYSGTGADGKYTIEVPKYKSYIISCEGNAFQTAYFKHESSLIFAQKIFIDSDKNDIDFVLLSKIPSTNRIEGKVIRSDINVGIESRIIFKKAPRGGGAGGRVPFSKLAPADDFKTVTTKTDGTFVIDNVIEDNVYYFIQAIPIGGYIPTLYKTQTEGSVIKWKLADSVYTYGSIFGLTLKSDPAVTDGLGVISGRVTSQEGESIPAAIIYAIEDNDEGGKIINYGISDTSGFYIIKGLRTGYYNLYVEQYDYTGQRQIHVKFDNPIVENADITLNPINTSIVTIPIDRTPPEKFALSQNFPNPFNPETTIEYSLVTSANIDIRIYDVLGREIAFLANEKKEAGTYRLVFNAKNHPSGFYFFVLQAYQNGRMVFMDKKKMVLVK